MTDPIEIKEREKYKTIWEGNNYQSGNQHSFAQFIKNHVNFEFKNIIEFGCGDAKLFIQLLTHFREFNYLGVDITTDQVKKVLTRYVVQRPIWNTQIKEAAELTVSCDVLEHIPTERVEQSIIEILRLTTRATVHAICTRKAKQIINGENAHLTVQPLEWWQNQFDTLNKKHFNKNIQIILIDSDTL